MIDSMKVNQLWDLLTSSQNLSAFLEMTASLYSWIIISFSVVHHFAVVFSNLWYLIWCQIFIFLLISLIKKLVKQFVFPIYFIKLNKKKKKKKELARRRLTKLFLLANSLKWVLLHNVSLNRVTTHKEASIFNCLENRVGQPNKGASKLIYQSG